MLACACIPKGKMCLAARPDRGNMMPACSFVLFNSTELWAALGSAASCPSSPALAKTHPQHGTLRTGRLVVRQRGGDDDLDSDEEVCMGALVLTTSSMV